MIVTHQWNRQNSPKSNNLFDTNRRFPPDSSHRINQVKFFDDRDFARCCPEGQRKLAWGKLVFERRPRLRLIMAFCALNGHGNQINSKIFSPRFARRMILPVCPDWFDCPFRAIEDLPGNQTLGGARRRACTGLVSAALVTLRETVGVQPLGCLVFEFKPRSVAARRRVEMISPST